MGNQLQNQSSPPVKAEAQSSELMRRSLVAAPPSPVCRPSPRSNLPQQLQQAQSFGHRLQQFQVQAKSTVPGSAAPSWHLRTLQQQAGKSSAIQRQSDPDQPQSARADQSSAPAPPVQFFIGKLIGALISPILKILFSSGDGGGGGDSGGGAEEASGGGADF